jgi:hypothetical protein
MDALEIPMKSDGVVGVPITPNALSEVVTEGVQKKAKLPIESKGNHADIITRTDELTHKDLLKQVGGPTSIAHGDQIRAFIESADQKLRKIHQKPEFARIGKGLADGLLAQEDALARFEVNSIHAR